MTILTPNQVRSALDANRSFLALEGSVRLILNRALGFPSASPELSEKCIHAIAAFQVRRVALSNWPLKSHLTLSDIPNLGCLDANTFYDLHVFALAVQKALALDVADQQTAENALYVETDPKAIIRQPREWLFLPTFGHADAYLTAAIIHANFLCKQPIDGQLKPFLNSPLSWHYDNHADQRENAGWIAHHTSNALPYATPHTPAEIIQNLTDRSVMLQTGKRTAPSRAITMTCANPEWEGVFDRHPHKLHGPCVVSTRKSTPCNPHPWSKAQPNGGVMSGLCAGPTLASQQSGHLLKLLKTIQALDPTGFEECFHAKFPSRLLFARLSLPAFPIHDGLSPRTQAPLSTTSFAEQSDPFVWQSPWVDSVQAALALPCAWDAFKTYFAKHVIAPALRIILSTNGIKFISAEAITQSTLAVLTDLVMTQGKKTTAAMWGAFLRAKPRPMGDSSYALDFAYTLRGESKRRALWRVATTPNYEINPWDILELADPSPPEDPKEAA